jgi:DNA-binding response OmpR family regulator
MMQSQTGGSARNTKRTAEAGDDVINVLLVEDDPAVLEMYRLRLELDGYEVHTARDGEEGLQKAGDLSPDIIFLDIRLPKLDGFQVLEKLRTQSGTKDIPVIILSNYSEKDLVDRGLKLGAHEYLIKAHTTPNKLSDSIGDWVRE